MLSLRSTSLGLGMSVAQAGQMLILLVVGVALQRGFSASLIFQVSGILLAIAIGAALKLEGITAPA